MFTEKGRALQNEYSLGFLTLLLGAHSLGLVRGAPLPMHQKKKTGVKASYMFTGHTAFLLLKNNNFFVRRNFLLKGLIF